MIGPEFSSCWLKFARASEHFDAVKAEVDEWRNSGPYSIQKNCDANGSRYSVSVRLNNKPPRLDRWSLISGDCLHNLRSSLDHVVYALAIKNSGSIPPPNERSLEFPIFNCAEEFNKRLRRIAPLSDNAKAFIEGLQPYSSGDPRRSFMLRTLNQFDNSDKHRLLHLAVSRMGGGEFKFEHPFLNLRPDIKWNLKPIEDGAELAFFTIDPPQLSVEYKVELSISITVNHVPAPNGSAVSPLLSMLGELLEGVREILIIAQRC